jgi:hypothetical protein
MHLLGEIMKPNQTRQAYFAFLGLIGFMQMLFSKITPSWQKHQEGLSFA